MAEFEICEASTDASRCPWANVSSAAKAATPINSKANNPTAPCLLFFLRVRLLLRLAILIRLDKKHSGGWVRNFQLQQRCQTNETLPQRKFLLEAAAELRTLKNQANPENTSHTTGESDFDATTFIRYKQITSSQALCRDSMFCKNYTVALIRMTAWAAAD